MLFFLLMKHFWCGLQEKKIKYHLFFFNLLYVNLINYGFESKRLTFITKIFNDFGMSNVWRTADTFHTKWITLIIEQKLKDQF